MVWPKIVHTGKFQIEPLPARDYGYSDQSEMTQILKRLQETAQGNRPVRARMASLRTECESEL